MRKPATCNGDLCNLPSALVPLTALPHWLVWRWAQVKEKWTKVPYQTNGKHAKTDDATTWNSYNAVTADLSKWDGIGFCLFNSEFCAFDIDNCRDPATGSIHPWANELVAKAASYTEITVSGTGLRIIGRGVGPKVHRKLSVVDGVSLEAYRQATRYIVMTGNQLPEAASFGITNIDQCIDDTVAELEAKKKGTRNKRSNDEHSGPGSPDDGGHHARQDQDNEDELERTIRDGGDKRHGQTRSEAVWWVINEMLRRGYQTDVIVKVLLDRRNRISDHVHDQRDAHTYVTRQIARAKSDLELSVNNKGDPIPSPSNINIALLKAGITLRYDQFADRILINGLPGFGPMIEDGAVIRIKLMMQRRFRLMLTKELLTDIIFDNARLNSLHPVRDYLNGLKWDGIKRIDKWLTTYAGADDTPYTRAVGALMLVAAVRRARHPGCKFDEMVILENPTQGTNRSTALAVLAVNHEWFSDDLPLHVQGKQVIEAIRGKWIIEAAELSGMRRTDIDHLKAFLSRTCDRGRMAYDRFVSDVLRQCIIVGTTNSTEYLRDTTGNRRYWPVLCQRINIEALASDRDQLWAEAMIREATQVSYGCLRNYGPWQERNRPNEQHKIRISKHCNTHLVRK
jgi:hypothetical protein